jgi:Domain of unknown function (DUF4173)
MNDLAWNLLTEPGDLAMAPPADGPPAIEVATSWPSGAWWVLACLGVGVGVDLARGKPLGAMAAVAGISALLVARVAVRSERNRARDVALVAGLVFAASLAWRTNDWLRLLDIVGVLTCLALVSDVAVRARTLVSSSVATAFLQPMIGWIDSLGAMERSMRYVSSRTRRRLGGNAGTRMRLAGLARGGLLAVPVVLVLGALLVSADAVFASLFRTPALPDLGPALGHSVMVGFTAWGLVAVVAGGALRVDRELTLPEARIGRTESLVVLGGVNALFAVFAIVQLVAIVRGAQYVQDTSGLTYAQYARSGFFQLLAVACLTLATIGVVRRMGGSASFEPAVRRSALSTCALTIVVTAVAFRRLWLYESAYGITVPRVIAHAGTITVGLILMVVAWGIGRGRVDRDLRGWVTSLSLVACSAVVVGLHIVNPSAWAARSTADRLAASLPVSASDLVGTRSETGNVSSVGVLASVDDDGLPALARRVQPSVLARSSATDDLPLLRRAWCADRPRTSWVSANLSTTRAGAARRSLCALLPVPTASTYDR